VTIDRRALGKAFGLASSRYDEIAFLQRTVRRELLERLDHFSVTPKVVIDLGAGTAAATRELKTRYPAATVVAADLSLGMLQHAQTTTGWFNRLWASKRIEMTVVDAHRLPFRSGSVDLIFSNLMLQWCDLDEVFGEVRRVLSPQGWFAFSTFGVGTLQELRSAWATVDSQQRVHEFFDMHDIGSALTRAGLREPVLDSDRHVLKYSDPIALMRSIKEIGAGNVSRERPRGLTSPRVLQAVSDAYPRNDKQSDVVATWEIVYGAAFGAPSKISESSYDANEIVVPFPKPGARRQK
jgi:malonyl-CoA O-methyltransferase